MPDFTLFIPLEIFHIILSHVNQMDCIEFMTVCRRWHNLIPQHGKDLWKTFEISKKSWPRSNNAMLQCLGTHVEKVSLSTSKNVPKILQLLERQQCNIQSLEIKTAFKGYTFDLERATVFNGIELFRKSLKELFIGGTCTNYFSLAVLLDLVPALTHLTVRLYSYHDMTINDTNAIMRGRRPNIESNIDDNNVNYNLVFLCLYSPLRNDLDIEQIARRCPQLKYLLVSEPHTYGYLSKSPIEFTNILELCPSIHNVPITIENEWRKLSGRTKRKYANNENNNNHGGRGANHLRQVEFGSLNGGQLISTLKACLQQPSLLEHLRLSGLAGVDLYRLWNTFKQHNSNLLSQPSQLKSFELVHFHIPYRTEVDISFQDLFNYFHHIERLKMNFSPVNVRTLEEQQQHCTQKIGEAIRDQLYQLRYLYFGLDYAVSIDSKMSLFDSLPTTLCDWNQKLEILHLNNVYISSDMLLDFCDHPMLHTLNLSGYLLHEQLTRDDWISFAHKLEEQEQEQNNNNRIQSLFLSCDYQAGVTDEVLQALASVESLTTLRIARNRTITDVGVSTFGSIRSVISKKHKKIQLYDCVNVLLENPHVGFSDTAFFDV